MDINKAFFILMNFEGGSKVVNAAGDRGGLTRYGISQAAYPKVDIANLTESAALAIYYADYWNPAGCAKIRTEIRYMHFDTAVNMGVATAIKLLQEAAGIDADGVFGPATLMKSDMVSAEGYLLHRLLQYNRIIDNDPSQLVFRKGWTNRIAQIYSMYRQGYL